MDLPYASLKAHAEKLLGLHGEFHRQILHHVPAEAIDDERNGFFGLHSPLAAIKKLVFRYFCACGFVFELSGRISTLHIRDRMCPALLADQKAIALRKIPCTIGACQNLDLPPVRVLGMPG